MISNDTLPFRKPADTHHPIHELISSRWSPRAFADRPVESETLHSLFEAARWAASAGNQQPWNFLFATKENTEDYERFASLLWERNALWAQNAPVLVLVVARLYTRPGSEYHSYYDVGMATANLLIQAVDHGLVTHPMGGFDANRAKAELNIPEGNEPLVMIALGYPGNPEQLSEPLRERELSPRIRKPLNEFVFEGRWQQPTPDATD
ncbi:MAG: nitroreductase family protein [Ktedonobacteraceae bacterium]|nr:nitroreductase family protein [Ktedonobacteraceae bacterium]